MRKCAARVLCSFEACIFLLFVSLFGLAEVILLSVFLPLGTIDICRSFFVVRTFFLIGRVEI